MLLLLKWFRDDHNSRQDLRWALTHDQSINWTSAKDLQQTSIEIATAEAGDALDTGPSKIGAGGSDGYCGCVVKRP